MHPIQEEMGAVSSGVWWLLCEVYVFEIVERQTELEIYQKRQTYGQEDRLTHTLSDLEVYIDIDRYRESEREK